jgi:hypothetical protein
MEFQQNLSNPARLGHVDVSRKKLGGLPSHLLARMEGSASHTRVPLDSHTLGGAGSSSRILLTQSVHARAW